MAFLNLSGLQYFYDKLKTVFAKDNEVVKSINNTTPTNGNVNISRVDYADNLVSDDAQSSTGTFIQRTSGGDASIADGDAWLVTLYGNTVKQNHVDGNLEMTVHPYPYMPRDGTITASVNASTFKTMLADGQFVTLTYGESWSPNPATYGVTVSGTPIGGDEITVSCDTGTVSVVVNMADDDERAGSISATVNAGTFVDAVINSSTETFAYTTAWSPEIQDYGIAITGTPVSGDSVVAEYNKTNDTVTLTVNAVSLVPRTGTITAEIDQVDYWFSGASEGETLFTYTNSWNLDLADYGISITSGTPVSGDTISVNYTAEQRGTIVPAQIPDFYSTGWNLFDYNSGYAKVLKYSNSYGFLIGGDYTSLSFGLTSDAQETTPITVTDNGNGTGSFAVPSDGYVFVTGAASDTTFILMTWSDWTSASTDRPTSWAEYELSTIKILSNENETIASYFPYGFLRVGTLRDEIDITMRRCISKIGRLAYTKANLKDVIQSGVQYDYDTNYIYYEKSAPDQYDDVDIDSQYSVSDHGIEYFVGTDVPIYVSMLYGQNLKDKLRRDVVTITPQEFNAGEKQRARINIGAASKEMFAVCSTAADVAAKTATTYSGEFAPEDGTRVSIRFANANTAATITLSVDGTGGYPVVLTNANDSMNGVWQANSVVCFVYYNGKYYIEDNIIPVSRGGTGATAAATALANLGAASSVDLTNLTSRVTTLESGDKIISGRTTLKTPIYIKCDGSVWTAPGIYFYPSDSELMIGSILLSAFTDGSGNFKAGTYMFRQYSYNSSTHARLSSYEQYALPTVSADLSATTKYTIITSKAQNVDGVKNFRTTTRINNSAESSSLAFAPNFNTDTNAISTGSIRCAGGSSSKYVSGRFNFRQFSATTNGSGVTSYYESYYLPSTSAGLSSSTNYYILTTKSAVTVAQGGTGATTAAAALTNLGAAADSAVVKLTGAQTVAGVKTFTSVPSFKNSTTSPAIGFMGSEQTSNTGMIYYVGTQSSTADYEEGAHFYFYQYSPNSAGTARTSYYDRYYLPAVSKGKTKNDAYEIYTANGGDIYKVVSYSYKYSIAANGTTAITAANFGITAISGYTIAGIKRFSVGYTTGYACGVQPATSGDVMVVRSTNSSAQTPTAVIDVLWIKTANKA